MKSWSPRRWSLTLLMVSVCGPAGAAFNAGVAPPRFELRADPGATVREVVTLFNASDAVETYLLRTADWDLQEGGGVTIHPPELHVLQIQLMHIHGPLGRDAPRPHPSVPGRA